MIWILVLLFSCTANAASFAPDNDLWTEDCLECVNINGITQTQFNEILAAGRKAYASTASARNEKLVILNKWTNSTVNASCSRYNGTVTITMYGGLARRKEVTLEGFALVLGHELNHAYGGYPYYSGETLSAEGQADYMSTKVAYAKFVPYAPSLQKALTPTAFIKKTCTNAYGAQTNSKYRDCIHALSGGQSLGNLLATLNSEDTPNYETPDQYRTPETIESYPYTIQCRVDSYLAGELLSSRPRCWYYK